ncbi:hypothetical protein O5823_01830 [Escherichia coli]|nr:hypothetical protein [Escherichia coli]
MGKDKPYTAFNRISRDEELKEKIQNLIINLFEGECYDPDDFEPDDDFNAQLMEQLKIWAKIMVKVIMFALWDADYNIG